MKVKAVIFDISSPKLLNGGGNSLRWFHERGSYSDGAFKPIVTIVGCNRSQQNEFKELSVPPTAIHSNLEETTQYLEQLGILNEVIVFVSNRTDHPEFMWGRFRTVLLDPRKTIPVPFEPARSAKYRAYDFDGLTRIVNLIEWSKEK